MKKALKIFLGSVLIAIVSYVLMAVLASILPGTTDSNGAKHLSGFSSIVFLAVPVLVTLLYIKLKRTKKNTKINDSDANKESDKKVVSNDSDKDVEHPLTEKESRDKSEELIEKATSAIERAYKCSSIIMFVYYGIEVNRLLKEAEIYEDNAGFEDYQKPSEILKQFNDDYQWKLRDAIEREEEKLISEINGPQHNNKRACCQKFYNEIESNKNRFSEETLQFAMDSYYRLLSIAGLTIPIEIEKNADNPMNFVDRMDGHEFEFFCAELLKKNGFTDVEVTKSSGDQGIDILAVKDEIRYGFQCKCYSSDLGNKPIQEAYAGKRIYNCQIAVVLTNRFFTQGGIEAAKATGVLLWDRNKLQSLIEKTKDRK